MVINYSKIHRLFSPNISPPLSITPPPPLYRHFFFLYLPSWPTSSWIFGILVASHSVLPPFHHEIGLLGVSTLFRLIYMHLMWKRLGREPLINAEVTAFAILILSGHFPRQIWWWWHLKLKRKFVARSPLRICRRTSPACYLKQEF